MENRVITDIVNERSQNHRDVVIDMVGYSRGAVIVATVAQDLAGGFIANGTPWTPVRVHWVGLFDPVNMFGQGVQPRPGVSWASTSSTNVIFCDAAIKQVGVLPTQSNLKGYNEDGNVLGNFLGGVGSTRRFWVNHIELGHDKRLINQIFGGTIGILKWMIGQAQKHGVPVN